MNAIAPVGRSLAPFEARLDGIADPVRHAAVGELRRVGLPGPRVEAWRYTHLRPLAGHEFREAAASFDADVVGCALDEVLPRDGLLASTPRLVLVNGRFAPELSSPANGVALPEGVMFERFLASPEFDALATPEREPLVALNTALATDGVRLSVAEGAAVGRIVLVSVAFAGEETVSFHPRHSVSLGTGASLELIEVAVSSGNNASAVTYFHNPVLTCSVGEGAKLTHVKVQKEAAGATHLATVYANIATRGAYDSFTLGLGADLARHEVHARLSGAKAAVHVNGAQLLGEKQVGDITSVITHAAPDCISRQTIRNVLTDHARGVFQGKVHVHQIAQKTDGYQMNQALLLSPHAEIDAKPELEIYADDVKCSHGATVGALDDEQLFYLRSRGVPEAQARRILVEAFLLEVLDLHEDEAGRALLDTALGAALSLRIGREQILEQTAGEASE
ncbi:Fe-S cluster assembly protein SufD [Acetobacter sacchari]|uniref:Fe-S cluster assembly protein SufD n=1 Tax=Acetobacter sacchari TaxID=2661687 RepID=A0ABS3LZS8_9PROT|nr:Fe-S cluster assembly protein SufD [Acetobacter sacchari]MBO1361400.1 Fe-S cluster assembly protein SufD [Acetobacter sacchari]